MDNDLKILLHLAKKQKAHTLLELSRKTKVPYTTLLRTVNKMTDTTKIEIFGKSRVIQIKWNEITIASLVIASNEEKKEFVNKNNILKKIDERSKDITLIFGSYAKKTQNKQSDIDIITINKMGKKVTDYADIEMLYDVKINPMYFTENEFKEMLQDNEENVGKQAIKDHVLLTGYTKFWGLVKDAIPKRTL